MKQEGKRLVYSAILAIITGVALVLSSVAFVMAVAKEQNAHSQSYIIELTAQNKNVLLKQIEGDFQTLHTTATFAAENQKLDLQWLIPLLRVQNDGNAFIRMGFVTPDAVGYFVDIDGTDYFGVDMSDRDYVRHALAGEQYLSATVEDRMGHREPVNAYAVPVWHDGKILGAICAIHLSSTLCDLIDKSFFNNSGFVRVITGAGDVVMRSSYNHAEPVASKISGLSFYTQEDKEQVEKHMNAGEEGSFSYEHNGERYLCGYAPLGINGWYIASNVPQNAVTANFEQVIQFSTIACIAVVLLFLLLLFYNYWTMRRGMATADRLAYYDALTGCYNKNKFVKEAAQILTRKDKNSAIVLLDILNFKFVNELYGFEKGDTLLRHMAGVLSGDLHDGEIFYRDNGDHFGVLLHFNQQEALTERVKGILTKITEFTLHSSDAVRFVCCAGIKIVDEFGDTMNLDLLIDRALMALQKAKSGHENNLAFYDKEIHYQAARKNAIENRMKEALNNEEFLVFLQPKYDLQTGQITGAEALTRWKSPKYGMIAPDQFIPIFEQNGFVAELDMYILDRVCRMLREWEGKGYRPICMAVNQSRLVFYRDNYAERVYATVKKYGIEPARITLEVTESIVMEDMDRLRDVLERLHELGFFISMDDFGSGYSSLNSLKNIYIDELKLDRVFLTHTAQRQRGVTIIKKMLELTKELGIKTVAEGVETAEQAEFLKTVCCDAAQGFYFARPMEVGKFEQTVFQAE